MENNKKVEEYINSQPLERRIALEKLRRVVLENLPQGYEERFQYNMITYVVPYKIYPKGYHVDNLELPFISLANQKGYISIYHMGLYSDNNLLEWFKNAYLEEVKFKLDMGKSCIRLKKIDCIPYKLIGELCSKIDVQEYVNLYEEGKNKRSL